MKVNLIVDAPEGDLATNLSPVSAWSKNNQSVILHNDTSHCVLKRIKNTQNQI